MNHDAYFTGASGRRYTYADIAGRIRKEAPHTLGKHIFLQLEAIGLLEEMHNGTTPCGLPFSFAEETMTRTYRVGVIERAIASYQVEAEDARTAAENWRDGEFHDRDDEALDSEGPCNVRERQPGGTWRHVPRSEWQTETGKAILAEAVILDLVRYGLMTLGDADAEFGGGMYWFDDRQPDWNALMDVIGWETARAAIAEAAGTGERNLP